MCGALLVLGRQATGQQRQGVELDESPCKCPGVAAQLDGPTVALGLVGLVPHEAGEHISNSDPVTGQAAWYDVRVRVIRAEDQSDQEASFPQFPAMKPLPGMQPFTEKVRQFFAGKKGPAKGTRP